MCLCFCVYIYIYIYSDLVEGKDKDLNPAIYVDLKFVEIFFTLKKLTYTPLFVEYIFTKYLSRTNLVE